MYRQKQKRFALRLGATMSDGVVETKASTFDVSRDGFGVSSDWTWPCGSRVTLRLATPAGNAVARAVVRHSGGGIMGLQLLARGPGLARLVDRVIAPGVQRSSQ